MELRKLIEYQITREDGDVDHIRWYEAKKMLACPPADVVVIERITRWWRDDAELMKQRDEILFEREGWDE